MPSSRRKRDELLRRSLLRTDTQAKLKALNRRFYEERASEFSASRERPWSGWKEIFDHCRVLLPERPRVLDVGCGNGRFARFLDELVSGSFDYWGVDSSPLGLAEARRRLASRANVTFLQQDFLGSDPLPHGDFDLIALFGVLHHVPGRKKRFELLKRLSDRLAPGGILAYSIWLFDRHPRYRKKIVAWTEFLEAEKIQLDLADLEPGDHIVRWGGDPPAFRYCHALSDEEERDLVRSLPLDLVLELDAAPEPNRYHVLRLRPV